MPSSSVSTETPVQTVSSFDHFVTQWTSTVTVSRGSFRNSSQVHFESPADPPSIEKSHRSSDARGVGPADNTGKSLVSYWPGGIRSLSARAVSLARPLKPREMNLSAISTSLNRNPGAVSARLDRHQSWGFARPAGSFESFASEFIG